MKVRLLQMEALPLHERANSGLDITIAGSARERSRGQEDLNAETHNLIFDARYAMPLAVWQEAQLSVQWPAGLSRFWVIISACPDAFHEVNWSAAIVPL